MMSYRERNELLTQFYQLALSFTASNHPLYGDYFCAWFTKGAGQQYEKFVTEFNRELKDYLIQYNAERSFKEAMYGESNYKEDGSRNWYPDAGLVDGESSLLRDFLCKYSEIARFFQRKFSENFPLFLEMNAGLNQFYQEINSNNELKIDHNYILHSIKKIEKANDALKFSMKVDPNIVPPTQKNINNEAVELCLPGNERVKTNLDQYSAAICKIRSEKPVSAKKGEDVNEIQLQLVAKGLAKFGLMAQAREEVPNHDNDACSALYKLSLNGYSSM